VPFIKLDGERIFYEVFGSGRCVVLIHGAWASHKWWKNQIPVLSKRYKVIAVDLRGHGLSSELKKPISIDEFSNDIKAILEKEEVEEVALIGWSMGGIISMRYAIENDVKALVLIATRAHKNYRYDPVRDYIERFEENLYKMMSSPYELAKLADDNYRTKVLKEELKEVLSKNVPRELLDWMIEEIKKFPGDPLNVALSVSGYELGDRIKEIKAPTLIIIGDEDKVIDPSLSLRLKEIPNSEVVVLRGAGHYLILERAEEVNTHIISFLNRFYPP